MTPPRLTITAARSLKDLTYQSMANNIVIRPGRFQSGEYEQARLDLAQRLSTRLQEMDRVYDIAEAIVTNSGTLRMPHRGLSRGVITVVMLLLTKALKTFRAIRVAAMEGCGQDASILLRALFETATAIRWILQRNSRLRAKLYAAHADVRTMVRYQEQAKTPGIKNMGKRRVRAMQPVIDDWIKILGKDQFDSVRKHWSGLNSLEAAARKIRGWLVAYNTVYRETSGFAHGSDPAQHAMSKHAPGGFPVLKLLPGDDECHRTMGVAVILLFGIVEDMNKRFDLGLAAALETLRPNLVQRTAK